MDARQLYRCLEYVVGGSCEVYVVSRDYVRNIFYMGRTLIVAVNTETAEEHGAHWVVFYIYQSRSGIVSEFYDSYGKLPNEYLIDYSYPLINFNADIHQGAGSSSCAQFVISFIYHRIYQPPFQRAVSYFSRNTQKNERKVNRFYEYIKERVAQMPKLPIQCEKFGCYPKKNNSFKRRFD